jgi:hypothetical protein
MGVGTVGTRWGGFWSKVTSKAEVPAVEIFVHLIVTLLAIGSIGIIDVVLRALGLARTSFLRNR